MVSPSTDRAPEAGIDRAREARIGRELSGQFSGAQILQRAVRQAVKGVDGCDHAGISLRSHLGEVQTPAWTSPAVWAADAIQIALDEGPSLEPMWISDQVMVDDLSTSQRWPRWAPEVVKLGLRSLISVRLPGGDRPSPRSTCTPIGRTGSGLGRWTKPARTRSGCSERSKPQAGLRDSRARCPPEASWAWPKA